MTFHQGAQFGNQFIQLGGFGQPAGPQSLQFHRHALVDQLGVASLWQILCQRLAQHAVVFAQANRAFLQPLIFDTKRVKLFDQPVDPLLQRADHAVLLVFQHPHPLRQLGIQQPFGFKLFEHRLRHQGGPRLAKAAGNPLQRRGDPLFQHRNITHPSPLLRPDQRDSGRLPAALPGFRQSAPAFHTKASQPA